MKYQLHITHYGDFAGEYTIESSKKLTILQGSKAVEWAQKKDYPSGHLFTFKGQRIRVWVRGHWSS